MSSLLYYGDFERPGTPNGHQRLNTRETLLRRLYKDPTILYLRTPSHPSSTSSFTTGKIKSLNLRNLSGFSPKYSYIVVNDTNSNVWVLKVVLRNKHFIPFQHRHLHRSRRETEVHGVIDVDTCGFDTTFGLHVFTSGSKSQLLDILR